MKDDANEKSLYKNETKKQIPPNASSIEPNALCLV